MTFPIPKNLKIRNRIIEEEMISPWREEAKINENVKSKDKNVNTKNKGMAKNTCGSTK